MGNFCTKKVGQLSYEFYENRGGVTAQHNINASNQHGVDLEDLYVI